MGYIIKFVKNKIIFLIARNPRTNLIYNDLNKSREKSK